MSTVSGLRGQEVEIRGETGRLVVDILQGWLEQQERRVEILSRKGFEGRVEIGEIRVRTRMIEALLRAWVTAGGEVGDTFPGKDIEPDNPEN